MDSLEQQTLVKLPLPEHDTKQAFVEEKYIPKIARRLRNTLDETEEDHDFFEEDGISLETTADSSGRPVFEDGEYLRVETVYDVRTTTCYHCDDAAMEALSFVICYAPVDRGMGRDARYCRSCAADLLEQLDTYIDNNADTLLPQEL